MAKEKSEKTEISNKNKVLNLIHIKIHGLRTLSEYKPSVFEHDLNRIIADAYKDECSECHEKFEKLKSSPEKEKSFMDKLLGG